MSSRAAPRPGRLALLAALLSCVASAPATAFEFFEGRLQLHGFFESRFAAINDDFNDEWDLGQWASVLNLEAEVDIAPNGWGPFILLQAYARINVSYDCVWTRGCGVFSGAQVYGDRANKLPRTRLSRERLTGFSGGVIVDPSPDRVLPDQRVGNIRDIQPFGPLFDISPEAAGYVFERYSDFRFATHFPAQRIAGPWLPENFPIALAALSDRANPFNPNDENPVTGTGGDLALPFRPAPTLSITDPFDVTQAQGIYYPNSSLVGMVNDLSSSQLDQSFRESKLAWNLGASQEDLQVVREAYVDMEVLDGALWGRLGYQTIVWGKTELFRNQDRWNPTDLGAGPLAGLEESRVGIWAGRFVYSFYEQGPFRDVRLEMVLLPDQTIRG